MTLLQKILRNLFGYAAFISAGVFATMVPVLLRAPFPHATASFHAAPYGMLLVAMRELIFLMPPVVAIVNGIAWLALRKGSASARPWALAASISFLVLSVPFFVADVVILQNHLTGAIGFGGVLVLFVALNLLGTAGVAAFGKKDALLAADVNQPEMTNESKSLSRLAPAA